MRAGPLLSLALTVAIAGCDYVAITITTDTGLIGIVLRGPVQPVCQAGVSCDAPFGASFTVQQNDRVVATFRSDAQGRFQVHLAPGAYLIVPGPDAPIISPSGQAKPVVVGPDGLTSVRLEFDTGIR
jgi:hypothetical protein